MMGEADFEAAITTIKNNRAAGFSFGEMQIEKGRPTREPRGTPAVREREVMDRLQGGD
jgi:hypothetical protein